MLYSDAPRIGRLNPDEDHTFYCDVDFAFQDSVRPADFNNLKVEYFTDFYKTRPYKKVPPMDISDNSAAIKVSHENFIEDAAFIFSCRVNYGDMSGFAEKKFITSAFAGPVNFKIVPATGITLETEFKLSADKSWVNEPLKCDFGYYNSIGRVTLPTRDTAGNFSSNDEVKTTLILPRVNTTEVQVYC